MPDPYVPGFTNDIFISFSHVDNLNGWVEGFHKHLDIRLRQLGVQVNIWRDTKLRGTDIFSDEIFEQLKQTALLISIVSPQGINSRWCEDERQAFERFAALNGGFRFGNHLRAIKVVKTPLPGDQHRDLFETLGFEFYRRETQSHRFHEFDQSSPEFHHVLDELAQDIQFVINEFRDHLHARKPKEIVYVATTTPALNPNRDAIVRQLEDWGYAVIPQSSELLRQLASFNAVAKAELANALFSVHLVSDEARPIVDAGHDSITGQYDLAQSLKKDRIVWAPSGSEIYAEFEEVLAQGLPNGIENLKGSDIENLKDVIEQKLKQPAPSPVNEAEVDLYLICDYEDHPSLNSSNGDQRALQIKEYLDGNGLLVMPPPFSRMKWSQLKRAYREQLEVSKAVLLYWGTASEDWFLKTQRIIVNERNRRSRTSGAVALIEAFYFSSPALNKSQYREFATFVFEQYEEFEPDALQPLLVHLLTNEEAR